MLQHLSFGDDILLAGTQFPHLHTQNYSSWSPDLRISMVYGDWLGKVMLESIDEPMSPSRAAAEGVTTCHVRLEHTRDRISEAVEPKALNSSLPKAQSSGFWSQEACNLSSRLQKRTLLVAPTAFRKSQFLFLSQRVTNEKDISRGSNLACILATIRKFAIIL